MWFIDQVLVVISRVAITSVRLHSMKDLYKKQGNLCLNDLLYSNQIRWLILSLKKHSEGENGHFLIQ